ncbi:MAG: TAXI family TRAP transporter solute-binding subunit [Thermodesulfobacteriota bacterium]|nr:TAXI family TRAP transporter solute-binding subunit [Thermodesulfobacteriota bacterium]
MKKLKSLLSPFGLWFCARGKALFTILALFFFINALGTLDATQAQTKSFTITSGPMGGDWYSIGGAMGEIAKKIFPGAVVTVTTGGAVANLAMVNTGKADVGLSMAKLYGEALTGKGEYEGKRMPNLRAISFLANIPMSFFLVKADNPIQSIEEIKNKKIRILTAPKGSSPSLAAELMLKEYGITFDDIKKGGGYVSFVSYAEASNLIKDGHADAYIGPMVSAIMELTTTVKMKMLPIKESVLDKLKSDHNYVKVILPKDRYYFVGQETPHMAEVVIVIVQKELSNEVVYNFSKELLENPDRIRKIHKTYSEFDPQTAWQNLGGPLHPGAEKIYREKGYLK